jgi:hypothetical protein
MTEKHKSAYQLIHPAREKARYWRDFLDRVSRSPGIERRRILGHERQLK